MIKNILQHPKYGLLIALTLAGIMAMGAGYFLTGTIVRIALANPSAVPTLTPNIITSAPAGITMIPAIVATLPAPAATETISAANNTPSSFVVTVPPGNDSLPVVHPTFAAGQECQSCHDNFRGGQP